MMLPAVNQVHISVRLRAGSTPGKRRIGEGVTSQTNQCQRFDVFIHSGVKATFGGDGEVYFSLCLSGCHLCFNLLLYFSKPNREILRFFFLCFVSLSPPSLPRLSLHPLWRNLLHRESQLHSNGACLPYRISYGHTGLYLSGWMAISLDNLFSFPFLMLW